MTDELEQTRRAIESHKKDLERRVQEEKNFEALLESRTKLRKDNLEINRQKIKPHIIQLLTTINQQALNGKGLVKNWDTLITDLRWEEQWHEGTEDPDSATRNYYKSGYRAAQEQYEYTRLYLPETDSVVLSLLLVKSGRSQEFPALIEHFNKKGYLTYATSSDINKKQPPSVTLTSVNTDCLVTACCYPNFIKNPEKWRPFGSRNIRAIDPRFVHEVDGAPLFEPLENVLQYAQEDILSAIRYTYNIA